jgi:peptidyl-prolyl cis-trans isomerase B (cyclophilin B)
MVAQTERWFLVGLVGCGLLAGCGKDAPQETAPSPALVVPVAPSNAQVAKAQPGPALSAPAVAHAPGSAGQTFQDATLAEPPDDDQWLPEVTRTGKSVGKLYESVVAEWAKVPLVSPQGKKLAYTATITTDLGVVRIELWPDVAPNHVRNFVALARAGYYDGLAFDRAVTRERDRWLEAACPVGNGEANYGSIGYWLKPEINAQLSHDVGTIGACHGQEVESAACKFYITLSRVEWMDGNFTVFGKVTEGLDVLMAIHGRPVRDDDIGDRPMDPVVMRSVTIECKEP